MSENPSDFFRKTLKEFKAADELLSSELRDYEAAATVERDAVIQKSATAEGIADSCMSQIESGSLQSNLSQISEIPSQFSTSIQALKALADYIISLKKSLAEKETQIVIRKQDYQKALDAGKKARYRKTIVFASLATTLVAALIFLHFHLLSETTLSFSFTLDGSPLSSNKKPVVTLDGQPFVNEGKIALGRHILSIKLENAEPLEIKFTAFYGHKDWGVLPLESSKGSVNLSSDHLDAEFELSGNANLDKRGKLPAQIDLLPVGTYQLAVRRNGWEIDTEIAIARDAITTNQTVFQYGSVKVTSTPNGLMVSTNNVEIGKTPLTLNDVKPAEYSLTISDGEYTQTTNINVESKETVRQDFIFRYGSLQLSSSPSGATIFLKGKTIGQTPLTIDHLLASDEAVQLQLSGYADTNIIVQIENDAVTKRDIKLDNVDYVKAMNQARDAVDREHFAEATNFIALALASETNDPAALELQDEVIKAVANAQTLRIEAEQKAERDRKAAEHDEVIAIIQKAINAVGGRDAITQFKSFKMVANSAGKMHGNDFREHLTLYIQLPNRIRLDQELSYQPKNLGLLTLTVNSGKPSISTVTVTENGSWEVVPSLLLGQIQQRVPPNAIKELRNNLHIFECETLASLLEPDYQLEKTVGSTSDSSVAIIAHKDGESDATLFFDKNSGLLTGIDTQGLDAKGNLVSKSMRYSNYRSYSGMLFPAHTAYRQGGTDTYSSDNIESFEPLRQYYGNVFDPPSRQ